MEKFVQVGRTIKVKKVRNNVHIPDDLAFSILSKLPLKSCKRFRCVRKSWSLLFKNPNFMNEFRNNLLCNNNRSRSDYSDIFLLLSEGGHDALYLLPNEKFDDRIKLDLPPPFEGDDSNIYIFNSVSVNGILCLGQNRMMRFRCVLWNPATHEFILIPPSPDDESVPPYHNRDCEFRGFGYDPVRDDYKVIRYVKFDYEFDINVPEEDRWHEPMLEIYSLRSNSWRIIHANMNDYYFDKHDEEVYLNGMCHWWADIPLEGRRSGQDNRKGYLLSFDFTDEVFYETPMMLDWGDAVGVGVVPMVLNDSVGVISFCYDTTVFHISILGELGEEKSWFKLCIIRLIPSILYPIGVWKNGHIYFRKQNNEPVWINLSTRMINEIGIKRENYGYPLIGIYKENLLARIRGIHS
ncbi:F-box/kelch-repeat protein At3g06240-like [Vicia villosa]|uniref:F-box/kelch-repeat protein At3g06240-like n=1 Tax=Vicia villosa TaxID=3911 RepID=UPI00273BDFFA|nr:F-box/kelch-repeat protein At3g06240-like [Vicia villosa]